MTTTKWTMRDCLHAGVAIMDGEQQVARVGKTNAERIVQCVNAHDEILAALEEVAFIVDGMEDIDGNGNPNTAMKIMAAIEPILRKVRA
jgi:hypothetical protein